MSRQNSNGSYITDVKGVAPVATLTGGPPPLWEFPELSGTQTFKAGEAVQLSGGHGEAIGLTRADQLNYDQGFSNYPGSGFGVLGFAADDADGSTSAFKGVWLAVPNVIWEANVNHNSTSANAQTAATDLGASYGLKSLSGVTYVDKGTLSSDAMVKIVGFSDVDDVPCYYGRVQFVVFPNKCQLNLVPASSAWNTHGGAYV